MGQWESGSRKPAIDVIFEKANDGKLPAYDTLDDLEFVPHLVQDCGVLGKTPGVVP
jgi:hypothetical protein